ncbi:MAG: HAD family phosphatase [Tatlockia sp.]|nr:HAD family phosphatase [Tatlockia sp.]
MFDAIIFDFDGVILDSEPLHYEACCEVLEVLGIELSYEEYIENYLGLADKDMFPKLLSNKNYSFSAGAIKELIHTKVAAYITIINSRDQLPLIDHFEQFLFNMAPKVKQMAICSGSAKTEIAAVLSKVRQGELQTYFNAIVTSEDIKKGKPSPEGYLLTARRLNLCPSHCLVIEDTPHGVLAAKAAGMRAIGLLTTYDKHQFVNADKLVTGFKQLLEEDVMKESCF